MKLLSDEICGRGGARSLGMIEVRQMENNKAYLPKGHLKAAHLCTS
jgi:hypothetical protein